MHFMEYFLIANIKKYNFCMFCLIIMLCLNTYKSSYYIFKISNTIFEASLLRKYYFNIQNNLNGMPILTFIGLYSKLF